MTATVITEATTKVVGKDSGDSGVEVGSEKGGGDGDGVKDSGVPYPLGVYFSFSTEGGFIFSWLPLITYNSSFTTATPKLA